MAANALKGHIDWISHVISGVVHAKCVFASVCIFKASFSVGVQRMVAKKPSFQCD
jgi:hypothetical protein